MRKSRPFALWFCAFFAALLLGACQAPDQPLLTLSGHTMGTGYELRIVGAPPDREQLAAAIRAELDALDRELSTWRADSDISRFNQLATLDEHGNGPWFDMDERLSAVLQRAATLHETTGGALDVTLQPLAEAWGFQGDELPRVPEPATLARLLASSGMHVLEFSADGRSIRKRAAALQLDVSALAKGYAVDRLTALLLDAGLRRFSVEIGGEVRARGERPGGGPWRIGLEVPRASGKEMPGAKQDAATPGTADTAALRIALDNQAVATSGDYRNYFEQDGQRYAHVLDPATGRPAAFAISAATVVAADAMTADALATAFMVMPRERSLALAKQLNVELLLMLREKDGDFSLVRSAGFPLLDPLPEPSSGPLPE